MEKIFRNSEFVINITLLYVGAKIKVDIVAQLFIKDIDDVLYAELCIFFKYTLNVCKLY